MFIKDGEIRSFRVENNKVYTTIELNNLGIIEKLNNE